MDIRNLTTFVHVAELGSFSRAAERLGYSQPTISVQIRQLEQELGFRLFDRIGHAVRLTDKGHQALRHAQQVCLLCQQMTLEEDENKDVLIRLANIFRVSTDYLLGLDKRETIDVTGLSQHDIALLRALVDSLRNKNK